MNENKPSNRWRIARWLVYLLIGLAIPIGYMVWKIEIVRSELFGVQPPEMALAQHTPRDVIGDLGGMKVRIPRYYAEYVEYDGDPGFGEKRKGLIPARTFESKLRSFGMEVRFPDMKGLKTPELKEDYRAYQLKSENSWVSVSINSGEIYPKMGRNANEGLAKKLREKSEHWFANYERKPDFDIAELEAYVVAGIDPHTGALARESDSTDDVYIYKESNHIDTYISCGKTSVLGGVASCSMHFGLEPKAEVRLAIIFAPTLLPKWREIRTSVSDLIYSFEVKD